MSLRYKSTRRHDRSAACCLDDRPIVYRTLGEDYGMPIVQRTAWPSGAALSCHPCSNMQEHVWCETVAEFLFSMPFCSSLYS